MTEANQQSGAPTPKAPADPDMATELQALKPKTAESDDQPKKPEATEKTQQTPKPVPSMGRNVIVRQGSTKAPGMIVDVREDGTVDVQIFRADHMIHAAHRLSEIGPDAESGDGWFWPPRV